MLTYEITSTGYKILNDGVVWIVQEGEYATIFPGDTMEERAQAHIDSLSGTTTPSKDEEITQLQQQLAELQEELNNQKAINDILTGGDGNGTDDSGSESISAAD